MSRVPELPTLRRSPVCPAALKIDGACGSQQGIVCRIMQRDHQDDAGVGMSAAQSGFIQHEASGGVYLNLKSDPSTVCNFCMGDAVPVVTDADHQGRASYTYCSVWQAEKERIARGEAGLYEDLEPEPVSMGMDSSSAADPWAQARADLDLLAS